VDVLILIEPIAGGRFRARAGEPFGAWAEGATAEEAAEQLRMLVDRRLVGGARLAVMQVTNGQCAVSAAAPIPADDLYKTDWAFQELEEAIKENRRQAEAADP
jgi:hypothetical protein